MRVVVVAVAVRMGMGVRLALRRGHIDHVAVADAALGDHVVGDRKSTRLNSSHRT